MSYLANLKLVVTFSLAALLVLPACGSTEKKGGDSTAKSIATTAADKPDYMVGSETAGQCEKGLPQGSFCVVIKYQDTVYNTLDSTELKKLVAAVDAAGDAAQQQILIALIESADWAEAKSTVEGRAKGKFFPCITRMNL